MPSNGLPDPSGSSSSPAVTEKDAIFVKFYHVANCVQSNWAWPGVCCVRQACARAEVCYTKFKRMKFIL